MTKPRNEKMTLGVVETHHVWSRCVQQAFLCGFEKRSEADYSHRRAIIEAMISYQTQMLAIDLGSYSILDNHMHLIVRSRSDMVDSWSDEECAYRYKSAWPSWNGQQWVCEVKDAAIRKLAGDAKKMENARRSLGSISFFMGRVKQPLSWTFNREVERRGGFWEKRFGNRRLETDAEVLGCMLYCDLNQVRAGMADCLENSQPSAIQKRILADKARQAWIAEHSLESWQRLQRELERSDDACQEVHEQGIEALFQDCLLSPINEQGPLATTEAVALQEHPRQSEDITPVTRLWQEQLLPNLIVPPKLEGDDESKTSDESPEPKEDEEETKTIHRRMQRKLQRRKSDRCIVDIPCTEYLRKAKELAEVSVAIRTGPAYAAEDDWAETPFSVRKRVNRFLHSIADSLRGLLGTSDHSSDPRADDLDSSPPSESPASTTSHSGQASGQPPPDS